MERREFLRGPVMAGTILILGLDALTPSESEAASGPGKFYEGTLSGQDFAGWPITIGLAYARAQGSTYNPALTGDAASQFLLVGSFLKKKLTLTAYALNDLKLTQPLGTGQGAVRGTHLTGTLTLTDGRTGAFSIPQLNGNTGAMKKAAGTYDCQVEEGRPGFAAQLVLGKNGTFNVTNVKQPNGTLTNARYAGVFLIPPGQASNGALGLRAMFLPTGVQPRDAETILDSPCCDSSDPAPDPEPDPETELMQDLIEKAIQQFSTGPSTSVKAGPFYATGVKR